MRSLQFKFTMALLLTSLMSVVLVGFVAGRVMLGKFNQNAMQSSLFQFRGQVRSYISQYGSWQKAEQTLPFHLWIERHSPQLARPPANSPAPPPIEAPPIEAPAIEAPGAPPRLGPPGGEEAVRFRFGIIDAQGHVLLGPPELEGRIAPPDWRASAQPVMVNGRAAVYVVPRGEPDISTADRRNLDAMRESLVRGAALAMLLAVLLGIMLAHTLSRKLRELTAAMRAVGAGELGQRVAIQSNDEIGELALAFNRMSEELEQSRARLQASHTQIFEQAARLEQLSIRDELTQLFNRRHFDRQIAQIFEQATRYDHPLTVMIGDIDHFKRINDSFSHAVGDEVLRRLAAIFAALTRQSDIAARYGGEEFVVAFPETPLEQAGALCERLRLQIEGYGWHEIHPDLRVTMSMGLCADLSLASAEKMVAGADERLYFAKRSGRNQVSASETALEMAPGSAAR